MSIFGIGTDIVSVDRIRSSLKNKKFIIRIFHEKEILKCKKTNNSINCYAKRFAAKEAFSKALGLGISKGLKFKEIEINNNKFGQPFINVLGNSKIIVNKTLKNKIFQIHLSISDDNPFTVATVILTTK